MSDSLLEKDPRVSSVTAADENTSAMDSTVKHHKRIAVVIAVPLVLACGLSGLAALPGRSSISGDVAESSDEVVQDDGYFYGDSPPVYPSPEMTGSGDWAIAFNKATDAVANLTLEEKVSLTAGVKRKSTCSGNIPAIDSIDFPGLCLSDAGQGLRNTDFVSSFPSGIHVAASWNKNLTYHRGNAMGGEFRTKGVNVLLGPVVGPMFRVARGGRNWEGFSPDPFLSGTLVALTVAGVQDRGVMTSTKHFIANEQEMNRNPTKDDDGTIEAVSSNIDDRTMHELYLWPFQDAVKAGTSNIMCSYQRVNNSYGCANSKTQNGLLKTELGFQGFIVSDWNAQHAGVATALSGLDMTMPDDQGFWGDSLIEAVKNGSVTESRVDDMAVRILASWYQFGQDKNFPKPGVGMPSKVTDPHDIVDARDPAAKPTLLDGAIEGHVLVKNTKNTLPLKKPRMLSLFGYSAKSPDLFAPANGALGSDWIVGAEPAEAQDIFSGSHDKVYPAIAINGTMMHGGGSGATTPANFLSPFEALKSRAYADDTALFHDFRTSDPAVVPVSDSCIVFGNAWAAEGYDRPSLRDDYTDELITSVADQCNKTIVVLHNAGVRLVDGFIDHPNVSAVIFAHLPGQDSGPALVELLYGDSNAWGKLPYTIARNESDYGASELVGPSRPEGKFQRFPQSDFKEGVYIDYRHFDRENIKPRYEFGFGLSYTTFEFGNISALLVEDADIAELPTGSIIPGGQADLWDQIVTVKVSVKNTGDVVGAEVAQLYVGIPHNSDAEGDEQGDVPKRQLRGFEKLVLQPGQSEEAEFPVTRRDLSVWDVAAQKWRLRQGRYTFWAGNSSRMLPLNATVEVRN
ncbi:fibronectin type III-like domain-containing protein [Sarocladium implicatum]|nr:fibronectin type III-like domain-containing protein [Sarocladium implicatum]